MRRIVFSVTAAALAAGTGTLLGALYFARQIVVPRTKRKQDLLVRRVYTDEKGRQLVELPSSARTMSPGLYSLWFAGGTGHACIGPIIATNGQAATVTRAVERVDSGELSNVTAGIWSGYVYPTPEPLGLAYEDVDIPVHDGLAPAWKFTPADTSTAPGDWGIHIHGMGGTKSGALRGVAVADRLGMTSLVVSYRNDGQAPGSADGRYSLGQNEWRDVEAALAYAVDHGAQRIFLFGWSLGGSIALQAAARSKYRHQIVGLVLDAPVFDWTSTLLANARAAKLPKPAAVLGLRLLGSTPLRQLTGLREPLKLSELDWLTRAQELRTPMLVLHSEKDRSTPFDISRQMDHLRPDLVSLVPFQNVEHTQEWNIDMERWEQAVFSWVASRRD